MCGSESVLSGFAESEAHRHVAAQVFACLEFGLELRGTKRSNRRLFGLGQQWNCRSHHARTSTRSRSFCGSEQLSCDSHLPRVGGVPAQTGEPPILAEPIIGLSSDLQGFDEPRPCRLKVAGQHSNHAKVAKHGFNLIQVTGFSAEAHAL